MNIRLSTCFVLASVGLSVVNSVAAEPAAKPDLGAAVMGSLLRAMDGNQDGKLGVDEAVKSIEKLAQELDADGNGLLSDEELRSGGQKIGEAMRQRAQQTRQAVRQEASRRRADIGELEKRLENLGDEIERHLEELVSRLSKQVPSELQALPSPEETRRRVDAALADARQAVEKQVDQLQDRVKTMDCPVAERISTAVIDALDMDKDGEVTQSEIDEIVGNVFGITDSDADGSLSAKEVEAAIQASLDLVTEQARQQLSRSVDRLANLLRQR